MVDHDTDKIVARALGTASKEGEDVIMFYCAFGFFALAMTALVVGIAGAPGLGPLSSAALLVAFVFSAAGVVKVGLRRYHRHRHAYR
jgi:hypothetical protein